MSGKFRFALRVPNLGAATEPLLAYGAKLVHSPVDSPWGDRTVRFEDPDGMQNTLYQVGNKDIVDT